MYLFYIWKLLKHTYIRHTKKAGLWTHGLDAWTLDPWTFGLWTPGHLDSGRLDARTLYPWTLGIWILRPRKFYSILSSYYLKLVSAIFYQVFIFSPNDSPSKTIKNVISSKKLFSFLRYSIFFNFFTSFPHFTDSKGQMEEE